MIYTGLHRKGRWKTTSEDNESDYDGNCSFFLIGFQMLLQCTEGSFDLFGHLCDNLSQVCYTSILHLL
jgi:hypothetical protein